MVLGPFHIGDGNHYGRILNLHGTIALESNDVVWNIVTGDTAEEAATRARRAIERSIDGYGTSTYVQASGTWTAGRSHVAYPRTRALWCCLWLYSEGTWAWETANITMTSSAQWR